MGSVASHIEGTAREKHGIRKSGGTEVRVGQSRVRYKEMNLGKIMQNFKCSLGTLSLSTYVLDVLGRYWKGPVRTRPQGMTLNRLYRSNKDGRYGRWLTCPRLETKWDIRKWLKGGKGRCGHLNLNTTDGIPIGALVVHSVEWHPWRWTMCSPTHWLLGLVTALKERQNFQGVVDCKQAPVWPRWKRKATTVVELTYVPGTVLYRNCVYLILLTAWQSGISKSLAGGNGSDNTRSWTYLIPCSKKHMLI